MEVSKVARSYLNTRGRPRDEGDRTVTFSVRLTQMQNAKLLWLAEQFETAKTPLAQKLLDAAMHEALATMAFATIPDEAIENLEGEDLDSMRDAKLAEYLREIRDSIDGRVA